MNFHEFVFCHNKIQLIDTSEKMGTKNQLHDTPEKIASKKVSYMILPKILKIQVFDSLTISHEYSLTWTFGKFCRVNSLTWTVHVSARALYASNACTQHFIWITNIV